MYVYPNTISIDKYFTPQQLQEIGTKFTWEQQLAALDALVKAGKITPTDVESVTKIDGADMDPNSAFIGYGRSNSFELRAAKLGVNSAGEVQVTGDDMVLELDLTGAPKRAKAMTNGEVVATYEVIGFKRLG